MEESPSLQPGPTTSGTTPGIYGNGHPKPSSEIERALLENAQDWARESGLQPPFYANTPHRVEYPRQGFGWHVTVHEKEGRRRMGAAVFGADGQRQMWTVDDRRL